MSRKSRKTPSRKQRTCKRLTRTSRRGLSPLEVVLATGIMLPFAIALFFVGRKACGRLYEIIESLVTWSYL
jgi:hypothetical protein